MVACCMWLSKFLIRNTIECMHNIHNPYHATRPNGFVLFTWTHMTIEHIGFFIRLHSLIILTLHICLYSPLYMQHTACGNHASAFAFETYRNAALEPKWNLNWGLFVSSIYELKRISWIRTFTSDCCDLYVGAIHTNPTNKQTNDSVHRLLWFDSNI